MATKLENVHVGITDGTNDVSIILRGTLKSYEDLATIPSSGFVANAAGAADFAKTLGVITPVPALLASGSFRRVKASDITGKKSRTFIIPNKSFAALESAVSATGGFTIDGVACTSLSKGLRRVSR